MTRRRLRAEQRDLVKAAVWGAIAVAGMAWLSVDVARAADAPLGLKGAVIGDRYTPATLGAALGAIIPDTHGCWLAMPLGATTPSVCSNLAADGTLERLTVSFVSPAFEDLSVLLVQKYGPPAVRSDVPLTNAVGGAFMDVILTWRDSAGDTLTIDRYGWDALHGSIVLKAAGFDAAHPAKSAGI